MIYVELKDGSIYEIENPDKYTATDVIDKLYGSFIRIYERIFAISEIKQIKVEE